MGGFRSGRRYRSNAKETTDESLPLDVRALYRAGLLKPGGRFGYRWWRGDNQGQASSISGWSSEDHVRLVYRQRGQGGEWQDVEELVWLDWTPCHYGGVRPWWLCPGVMDGKPCGRRVAVLYGAGEFFLCRHCYELAYPSQREDAGNRALRRTQAIRQRLGGSASLMEPFPDKPKGMHYRTYWRLMQRSFAAERVFLTAMREELDRMQIRRRTQ